MVNGPHMCVEAAHTNTHTVMCMSELMNITGFTQQREHIFTLASQYIDSLSESIIGRFPNLCLIILSFKKTAFFYRK